MATKRAAVKAAPKTGTETGLSKNQIIEELTRSPHGKLDEYLPRGMQAAAMEPEFFARLIAWDAANGQIRDSKVALPVVSLATPGFPDSLVENSLAHMAKLNPRMLLQAARFAKDVSTKAGNRGDKAAAIVHMKRIKNVIGQYLTHLEADTNRFDAVALQHRATLKELYALFRSKDGEFWATAQGKRVQSILFRYDRSDKQNPVKLPYPKGSVFEAVAELPNMSPKEAAGTIMNRKIPFLIAKGALGAKAKDPDLLMALIDAMTGPELVNNAKALETLGVKDNPVLKAAYAEALKKATDSGKTKNTLKATKAAAALGDEKLKKQMQDVQEKQIASMKGIEGNWLVLGDRSPSMSLSIKVATEVAATLTKFVKGKVLLIFFDGVPAQTIDATGMTLEDLKAKTEHMTAGGSGTSIGCGLMAAVARKFEIDGVAIVSDAQENTAPKYADVMKSLQTSTGKMIPTYLYRVQPGSAGYSDVDLAKSMAAAGLSLSEFDIRNGIDYYSLPNLVQTMRSNPYSLVDEIMETPLLTLKDVFGEKAA